MPGQVSPEVRRLFCAKKDNTYCIQLDPATIANQDIVNVSSREEFFALTSDTLKAKCNQKSDQCSRQAEYMIQLAFQKASSTRHASATPPVLGPDHLCQRDSSKDFCLPKAQEVLKVPQFLECLNQAQKRACNATCAELLLAALKKVGCCDGLVSHAITFLWLISTSPGNPNSPPGPIPTLTALRACKGLEQVNGALQQKCGGQAHGRPALFSVSMNVPCRLLSAGSAPLMRAFAQDMANLAGVDPGSIGNVVLNCDPSVRVKITGNDSMGAARPMVFNTLQDRAPTLPGINATFAVYAPTGSNIEQIKKQLDARLTDTKTQTFPNLETFVKSKCAECPSVQVMATKAVTDPEAELIAMTKSQCDPFAFMKVLSACEVSTFPSMSDAEAEVLAQKVCPSTSECQKALAEIGEDKLKFCTVNQGPSNQVGLKTLLTSMCIKNTFNQKYCMNYVRSTDAQKDCEKASFQGEAACRAGARAGVCAYDAEQQTCGLKLTQEYLDGLCGGCMQSIVTADTKNAENKFVSMQALCTKVQDKYCAIVTQGKKKSNGLTSEEMCGMSITSVCARQMTLLTTNAQERQARAKSQECGADDVLDSTDKVRDSCSSTAVARAQQQKDIVDLMLSEGCNKAMDGQYCIDKLNEQKSSHVNQCYYLLVAGAETCPTNCTGVLEKTVGGYGCCLNYVQSMTVLQQDQDLDTITASAIAAQAKAGLRMLRPCVPTIDDALGLGTVCQAPARKALQKRFGLQMRCRDLSEQVKVSVLYCN